MGRTFKPTQWPLALLITGGQLLGVWAARLGRRFRTAEATGSTRGDVPGWVLITLMSAVLVAGLLAVAGPALEKLFTEAMDQVHP
ncbi:MAG: hypothetical protein WBX27_19120 [Specibacter sp.]